MQGLNKTELIGNVGTEDARIAYLPSGTPVSNFSFAVNESYTDRGGQTKEKTTWFKAAIYGKRAENIYRYIVSGKKLFLEGSVGTNAWNGEDGSARADLTLKVNKLIFLDSKRGDEAHEVARSQDDADENYTALDDDDDEAFMESLS